MTPFCRDRLQTLSFSSSNSAIAKPLRNSRWIDVGFSETSPRLFTSYIRGLFFGSCSESLPDELSSASVAGRVTSEWTSERLARFSARFRFIMRGDNRLRTFEGRGHFERFRRSEKDGAANATRRKVTAKKSNGDLYSRNLRIRYLVSSMYNN